MSSQRALLATQHQELAQTRPDDKRRVADLNPKTMKLKHSKKRGQGDVLSITDHCRNVVSAQAGAVDHVFRSIRLATHHSTAYQAANGKNGGQEGGRRSGKGKQEPSSTEIAT